MAAEYVYITDIDQCPCVTAKKDDVVSSMVEIDPRNVIVVVKEIESWYLAGLTDEARRKLGIAHEGSTDEITKEQFNALVPKEFESRLDFKIEILKLFSMEAGIAHNRSLGYLIERVNRLAGSRT